MSGASCSYKTAGIPDKYRNGLPSPALSLVKRVPGWQRREHRRGIKALAVDPSHLSDLLIPLREHAILAYERVVFPCQSMNCGDVVYRSSLDPILRMEQKGINPQGLALLGLALAYLTATPGVLAGAIDYYILDKYQRLTKTKAYGKENIKMGKKLAQGGFGTVFRGELVEDDGDGVEVVVKKAKEFGEAEVWMNERLMRAAPGKYAEFITAFEEGAAPSKGKEPDPLWLVWRYEGDSTLWNLMQKREFPYNLEPLLLGGYIDLPKGPQRSIITIRLVLLQVIQALKASHATGIVHRDIKPQNVIISETDARAKLIDLGAAADLRVGINYVPNEYLLDPRYAPPQQYIMSTQTPRAPPVPVAATLSPILWRLNNPDRFDMYSVGVMLLQMVFQPLRTDNALIACRRQVEGLDHDLAAWRKTVLGKRPSKEYLEGFQLLDLDNGAMWDLLLQLMAYQPGKRLSAPAALRHPALGGGLLGKVSGALQQVGSVADKVVGDGWVTDAMARGTGPSATGLTEAQLSDELGSRELPPGYASASKTISWWQQRQAAFKRAAQEKRYKLAKNLDKIQKNARRTIRSRSKMLPKLWNRTS